MYYTPLGGSPIIDELVHTHNCASPVTFSIVIQTPVGGSHTKIVKGIHICGLFTVNIVSRFTRIHRGSPINLSQGLHYFWWFGNRKYLGLQTCLFPKTRKWIKNQWVVHQL